MIKGVPLSVSEEQLKEDVASKYEVSSILRLTAQSGAPLCTVKVEFRSFSQLQTALNNAILLESTNTNLRAEVPYINPSAITNITNG